VAEPLAAFPVFGPEPRLEYRAFVQAAELGAFVKEVESGAVVTRLSVENPTDLPLLVYEGEDVLGAQQNPTFDVSVLVPAGERILVPVTCVEQGRWDNARHREAYRPSPQAADPSLRRTKRATANAAGRVDQNEVWAEVSGRLAEYGVHSDSAAMSDLYDVRRTELDRSAGHSPRRRPDRSAGLSPWQSVAAAGGLWTDRASDDRTARFAGGEDLAGISGTVTAYANCVPGGQAAAGNRRLRLRREADRLEHRRRNN
jgi:hypothetical protein